MRRLPPLLAAATCCAFLAAPHAIRAQEPWRALVGCYQTERTLFSLDSVPFVGVFADEEGARFVRSGDRWNDRLEKMWRMPTPDSVRIRFEHGMYGWTYHLGVRGDTLVGLMTSVSDIVPPPGTRQEPVQVRAVRVPCPPDSAMSNPPPDSAELADLYGYIAVRPTDAQLRADPWGSVAPLRAWLLAHPRAAATWDLQHNAEHVFRRAADYDVRVNGRPLTGTYRLELERTGGPTLVLYGRTETRPQRALRPDSFAPYPDQPPGYELRLTLSADSATLPRPGPGRQHPRPYGGNTAANSRVAVRLPAERDSTGALRFHAHVLLVNFASFFRARDRALAEWVHEWFQEHDRMDDPPTDAEILLWPDGRVTLTQREELSPGRVVTLRGERISRDAWECAGDRC